jgi:lycopene beta-cyclase
MIRSGKFSDKTILLADQDPKRSNDRTWCFWEKTTGWYEPIVVRSWKKLSVHSESDSNRFDIDPYRYKMIKGIDFYNYCLEEISRHSNISFRQVKVDHVFSSGLTTGITTGSETLHSEYVFNSILFEKPVLSPRQYWLIQHFMGWIIETGEDIFEEEEADIMDFRTPQQGDTAFCYVLPFSKRKALVEYTVFSKEILEKDAYDGALKEYILDVLKLKEYRIAEVEQGQIPMTNFRFSPGQNNVINIGTAGGQTRGSSGYTFRFIQKHSEALVNSMITKGHPKVSAPHNRHAFYDSVLLNILYHGRLGGKEIFTRLFRKNDPRDVLRFLDNESTLAEEMRIISSLPTLPFLKAAMKQV